MKPKYTNDQFPDKIQEQYNASWMWKGIASSKKLVLMTFYYTIAIVGMLS